MRDDAVARRASLVMRDASALPGTWMPPAKPLGMLDTVEAEAEACSHGTGKDREDRQDARQRSEGAAAPEIGEGGADQRCRGGDRSGATRGSP